MANMFNWDDLDLPGAENDEDVKARLDAIHTAMLAQKGLVRLNNKKSPGFNPGVQQAREVSVMTALGLEPKDIALVLDIDLKLLKEFYRKELQVSHQLANVAVARKALEMASSGRFPDMTKFWLQTRAKWKTTTGVELTGRDGGPVEVSSAKAKLAEAMGVETATGDEADAAGAL